jgi:hypothetical protein
LDEAKDAEWRLLAPPPVDDVPPAYRPAIMNGCRVFSGWNMAAHIRGGKEWFIRVDIETTDGEEA